MSYIHEVKRTARAREAGRVLGELQEKAARCPELGGKRVLTGVWVLRLEGRSRRKGVWTAADVVD